MTKFLIRNKEIIGVIHGKHQKRWKHCKWCNSTFLPKHNRQEFCSNTCKKIARQRYKSNWMYTWRTKVRNGEITDDRSILNVGTGNLGAHSTKNWKKEQITIEKEIRRIGVRR